MPFNEVQLTAVSMRVLTIKSVATVSADIQNEIHFTFGMEHHTDYVFKDKEGAIYSATISLENTEPVIAEIIRKSVDFSDMVFIIDDLDLDNNTIERYKVKDGVCTEHLKSTLDWKAS